jgi:hypothetical protein
MENMERLGIRAKNVVGEQRVICPTCSPIRRKKGLRCLSVKIDEHAGIYNCWHCGWSGAVFADQRPGNRVVRNSPRDQPGDLGAAGRRVRYGILP